jgi:L,D-peptidoglycan transpeptidase YkuD (ErfK/YbiS/YcfS/YnhG family)
MAPAVTAPAKTTAPKTTAPKTTAPKTTAPKTTAPKTTAPKTTTPTSTAPPKPNFTIPVTLGNASQLITVTAPTSTSTSGTLRAWQKSSNGTWRVVYGPVTAWVGSAGIGKASETTSRTPLGTFTLTEAFGRLADPGTALPYHQTGPNDWWVSDTRAASYNTMQTCAKTSCPFNTRVSEHLQSITPYYNYAVVMDVNRSPVVPGAGSAFFLHVSVGQPTAGCVAIDSSTLVSIMRWLNPAQHPRIATGIG